MTIFNYNEKKGNSYKPYEFINPIYTSPKTNTNYVDGLLKDAYAKFLPWTKKTKDIYVIEIPAVKSASEYWFTNVSPTALNLEWNKAATNLLEYAYYLEHPTYDFMINGEAVKIHGNYIQIGSKIIPTFTKSNFFNSFSNDDKIAIYNISLNINATFAA